MSYSRIALSRGPGIGARVGRFFRTPKGLLLIVLVLLAALAAPGEGYRRVWPNLAAAVLAAGLIDVVILRLREGSWEFPSGAVLTGLFIAMVLSPVEPWYVAASGAAIAVLSKYVFRTRSANVFNPAALALMIVFYAFHTAQNWWGALPEVSPLAVLALFATGIFITARVNKMPLVLVFLGAYFALFSAAAFAGAPSHVAEIFRSPDLQAVLFFAFFILTDPPTSPVRYRPQIGYALIVAAASFICFELLGVAYYLLAGVLIANVWEAWRRVQMSTRRAPARAVSAARG